MNWERKQTTLTQQRLRIVCFTVYSGSSGGEVFQVWTFNFQKSVNINFLIDRVMWNLFGWHTLLAHFVSARSNVPSIHVQWLYIVENHLLQLQNIVKRASHTWYYFRLRVSLVPTCQRLFCIAALHEWCNSPSHDIS